MVRMDNKSPLVYRSSNITGDGISCPRRRSAAETIFGGNGTTPGVKEEKSFGSAEKCGGDVISVGRGDVK